MKNKKKWVSIASCFCAALLSVLSVTALMKPFVPKIQASALSKSEYDIADYEWANYFNFANVDPYANGYFKEENCTITKTDTGLSIKFLKDVTYQDGVNIISRSLRLSTDTYNAETGVLPDITAVDCKYIFTCETYIVTSEWGDISFDFPVKLILCVGSETAAEITWIQSEASILTKSDTNRRRMYLDIMPNMTTNTVFYADYTYVIRNIALYKGETIYEYTPYFYSLETLPTENPDSGGSGNSGEIVNPDDPNTPENPTGDYAEGYQAGVNTAKYSFFYGVKLGVSLLLTNGSVTNVGSNVPFGYVHGGISLSPTLTWLAENGYNMADVSGVRLNLTFADPVPSGAFHIQAIGRDDCFVNLLEAVFDDNSTVPARFQPFTDKMGYGFQTQESELSKKSFKRLKDWDIYGINNLADLVLIDYTSDYNDGYLDGFSKGEAEGKITGESIGYEKGKKAGESIGYEKGLQKSNSFVGLMTAIIDAPVLVFTSMLNFDVLGYNMRALALSLLTIALVICLIKYFSKGSAD